jgi:serine/threonine protein kinase/tetratricopeptide (TPR) repeat protein
MTTARWRAISPHLDRALDLPTSQRHALVDRLRGDDASLADELAALLHDHDALEHDGFLARGVETQPEVSIPGHRIGAYTLASPIGRGGMGSVWRAHRSDGRFSGIVAIKLLNMGAIGRAREARFTREGTILARLTHPHIARLIDAGVSDLNQPYLVLEHVDGEHIDAFCDRRALGIEARVRLFLDVLDAVAHAHANLVVHRDIKPSNVLVRSDGEVKLLDFGIAKLLDADGEAVSATTALEGGAGLTPEYAAPEQLTGGTVTTTTDVYALGMLLYVLLGGPRPAGVHGTSPVEWMKSVIETETPRLSTVAANPKALRGDLDNIVAKALKKAPGERYASASAMADDLRRFLRHEPVSARPDSVGYRGAKFVRRHVTGVSSAAIVVALVASLVGFYTVRLEAERDRARLEAASKSRVSDLLTSLLVGADPYATHDREPTVRNILDAGAARVESELADQPSVRADMLTVIGRVYQRLGLYDKAEPMLREALALGRARGVASAQLAQALNDLGVLVRERGDVAAATPLLEESLRMRRSLFGAVHKDVAVTLVELGRAYEDGGRADRAEALFRESLAIRQQVFGDRHRETATSKSDLAHVLRARGDLAGAESLFRQSLETSRAVLGEEHPNVATSWNNLGLVLLDTGDFAAAEPMFRRSLAIKRQLLGDTHPDIPPSLSNLASALREQGRYDEARALLQQALTITRARFGDEHQSIPGLEVNLARVNLAQNDVPAAETLLRDALTRQLRTAPSGDWRLAATRTTLADALLRRRDYRDAEPLLLQANAVLKDVPGRQGREAAATRERLVTLYGALGQPETAAKYRRRGP